MTLRARKKSPLGRLPAGGLLLLALLTLPAPRDLPAQPTARAGLIDLRGYDWDRGPIALDGEWEFYWRRFIQSDPTGGEPTVAADARNSGSSTGAYRQVPGNWTEPTDGAQGALPRVGFASYRLRIRIEPTDEMLGLKIFEVSSAYRLYVNGRLRHVNGDPRRALEEDLRWLVRPYLSLHPTGDEIELVLEVANRVDATPGPWRSLYLGRAADVRRFHEGRLLLDFFAMGVLLAIGCYHLGLFLQRRDWRAYLYFGLFALLMALRILFTEEHYVQRYFPGFPARLEGWFDTLWLYCAVPIMLAFIRATFPRDFPKKLYLLLMAPALLLLAAVLVWPRPHRILDLEKVLVLAGLVTVSGILLRATWLRRPGAPVFLGGWLVFAVAAVFDILSHSQVLSAPYVSHAGFLVFVGAQAYFLSLRYNRALYISENLAGRLDSRVRQRTAKLNEVLDTIRQDLQLARRVQLAALNDDGTLPASLRIARHYLPMEEVGGDLYLIRQLAADRVRIFLADAIGHGVQAALVTMTIKGEFEHLDRSELPPGNLLAALNDSFLKKHVDITPYFSCFLIDIDLAAGRARYASAGHPDQFLLPATGPGRALPKSGPVIGLRRESRFPEHEIEFEPGARLFLFSDGLFEQFDEAGRLFGEERLHALLNDGRARNVEDIMATAIGELHAFMGSHPPTDDITLLGIAYAKSDE